MTAELDALRASWQRRQAAQQPPWPDPGVLAEVAAELATLPPLVVADECRRLADRLGEAARGEAFLLQGGDCAETFAGATADAVRDKVKVLLQMAVVLTYGAAVPVVKVGRIAGQYAKPRSRATEILDDVEVPVYRGDAVNGLALAERTPDPHRMLRAYHCAAATLNLVRAFATGGYADLRRVHAWTTDFVRRSPAGERYEQMAGEIDHALAFMRACGVDLDGLATAHGVELFASHEALLLEYESALTRFDEAALAAYDLSAHLLWVGDRTRDPDGAHVDFLSRIANPVGVKLGPCATPNHVTRLVERLDPHRVPGRLTLVTRLGAARVRDALPPLVAAVEATDAKPVWACDPMHGNTVLADGLKTRRFDDVVAEVTGFFEVHAALGSVPGGLHVELTGDDVTECLGGGERVADLGVRYETACDPRLNTSQSLELAFLVAEMLRARRPAF